MTASTAVGVCGKVDCPVTRGEACLLGHADPLDCEAFEPAESGSANDDIEDRDSEDSEPEPDNTEEGQGRARGTYPHVSSRGHTPVHPSEVWIPLHSGEALTKAEATRVLQRTYASVVVPIGPVDVGKTTLLAGIYETVARAKSSYAFAGSLSLIGFESRCFAATAASMRTVPETERTTRDTEQQLLHLCVSRDGRNTELLLADVSGEDAQDLLRYNDPGQYESLLRAATHVLVLVDGVRLARSHERYGCLEEARTLIRALAEGNLVPKGADLSIVVTKGDALPESDPDVVAAIETISAIARNYWPEASRLVVSARETESIAGADRTGIPALLDKLVGRREVGASGVATPTRVYARASHAFRAGGIIALNYQPRRSA